MTPSLNIKGNKSIALLILVIIGVVLMIGALWGLPFQDSSKDNTSGQEDIKFTSHCRVLPREIVLAAVEESENKSFPSGEWADKIREGWLVLEVNVTMINTGSLPITLVTGGPACFTPFSAINFPLDDMPEITATQGEAFLAPMSCQLALVYNKIDPGDTHTTNYYLVTTPDYKGNLHLNAEICPPLGDCHTIGVDISINVDKCLNDT